MKPIRIYNPFSGRTHKRRRDDNLNPQAYAEGMIDHLHEAEAWIKMMHAEGGDKPAVCQLWTMLHHDGRIARMPDPYPTERMHRESQERQDQWLKEKLITINLNIDTDEKD